ncbi:imine reductase family protein [Streptomonospora litoralis]|uniref:2-hydroxy-3-oxopropionate reductase n=1 Tax=Streptomonospora litoralis TaxID=2498135 RepID=A0A4P6Q7P4_9ACTN|nr:NAD(P)-binding domain-containing protein [Streptomonospora litoralis]QBI56410.1 2-hydroxy-3-oxopropionate reductase [Streptomonospora litoralis]
MTSNETAPVAVIGLGDMGAALAGALLKAGHPTTVWNRTPHKADPLVEQGATRAASAAAAVAAAPLVVACVLDDAALRQALGGADLDGRTLVNLTNGTPAHARVAAAWAAEQGADYLDGGIMAVPAMIGGADCRVIYSGPRAVFDEHAPTLGAFGEARYAGADPGLAALHDLALLSGMYGLISGFLHAVAMVRSAGEKSGEFTTAELVPWVSGMTAILPTLAEQVDSGDFATEGSNLGMQAAGYANILDAARDAGLSTELMAPLGTLMNRYLEAGGAPGNDLSALVGMLHTTGA